MERNLGTGLKNTLNLSDVETAVHDTVKEGKQLPLFETQVRAKQKEQEAESVTHDFVRGLYYSTIRLHAADGYLGKLFRKYSPPARTMPHSHQLPIGFKIFSRSLSATHGCHHGKDENLYYC